MVNHVVGSVEWWVSGYTSHGGDGSDHDVGLQACLVVTLIWTCLQSRRYVTVCIDDVRAPAGQIAEGHFYDKQTSILPKYICGDLMS